MDAESAARWMLVEIEKSRCLYQEDVVDHLVRMGSEDLLIENSDGNLVLSRQLLAAFRKLTETTVVWVRGERYWRFRDTSDSPGRKADD